MRLQGRITTWKDLQGFGFITPSTGGKQVFVHVRSFSPQSRRPVENDLVSYEVGFDDQGRPRAENVAFHGENFTPPARYAASRFAFPVLFLLIVTGTVLIGRLPFAILALDLLASTVSFAVYAHDKSAARRGAWRTAESTLHLLSLLGGWPGAFVAQKVLHHKSRKMSFQIVFWATVVLNGAALVWFLTQSGGAGLRRILDATQEAFMRSSRH